jgi:hypothetical protein
LTMKFGTIVEIFFECKSTSFEFLIFLILRQFFTYFL